MTAKMVSLKMWYHHGSVMHNVKIPAYYDL